MRLVSRLVTSRLNRPSGGGGVRVRVGVEVPAVAWSLTTDLSGKGTGRALCATVQVSGAVEMAASDAVCGW